MAANTPTSSVIKPPATRAHQFPHKHKVYNLLHANCAPKSTPILQKGQTCHGINVKLARLHVRKATSKLARNGRVIGPVAALPGALLFDCDGVLVDTERDGHRISFNEAFSEKGLNVTWDVELYGELLKIGGGKERMTAYFNKTGWPDIAPKTEGERKEFIASLHRRKTELFMALIEKRLLPLRPGVARLIDEALEKGVKVAICSTSNEKAVSAIVQCLLGPPRADAISIFAGDVVPRKKPDPAIYLLAATTLGVDTSRCVVIEDSAIGLAAAKAAGMKCIVTKSGSYGYRLMRWRFALKEGHFACTHFLIVAGGFQGKEREPTWFPLHTHTYIRSFILHLHLFKVKIRKHNLIEMKNLKKNQ